MLAQVDVEHLKGPYRGHCVQELQYGVPADGVPLCQGAEADSAGVLCNLLDFLSPRDVVVGHSLTDVVLWNSVAGKSHLYRSGWKINFFKMELETFWLEFFLYQKPVGIFADG